MRRSRKARIRAGVIAGLCAGLLAGFTGGGALAQPSIMAGSGDTVPGYPDVIAEYLQIPGAEAAGTPAQLNTATFLRLRPRGSIGFVRTVDAVIIAQPGFSSVAGAWLETGAQIVQKAGSRICTDRIDRGKRIDEIKRPCAIEVWAIDRRGNNLEDTTGLRAARAVADPAVALRYYYGATILTPRGTFPFVTDNDAVLGRPDSQFRPLRQSDVGFMAEWGFETAAADIDRMIQLLSVPRAGQKIPVFLAGHSQGGGFVSYYAGRRMTQGPRGDNILSGLIFLDGGPAIGAQAEPDAAAIATHAASVNLIRQGILPRYGSSLGGITLGAGLGVRSAVVGLYSAYRPDAESIFPLSISPAHPANSCLIYGQHLPAATCGGIGLRYTYRAHAGMSFDDDPIPGSMMQTQVITSLGNRQGRLDFTPRPGTASLCLAPGPRGLTAPCPPSLAQVDPQRVYGWLDGGGRGSAGPDGPLNGWTAASLPNGQLAFSPAFLNANENPSSVDSYIKLIGFAPARTNIDPVSLALPSGSVTLNAGEMNGQQWYQPQRYELDSAFAGTYRTLSFDVAGITYDVDKTAIASPVYVAARAQRDNPFPLVTDYTAIGPAGTQQSEIAQRRSPIAATVNARLYGHSDFQMADDSLGDQRAPGENGANLVSNTLVDWVLARTPGTLRPPSPEAFGVRQIRP